MSNSIWKTPDKQPIDFNDVLLVDSRTGACAVFFTPFHNKSFIHDKWCYLTDIIAQADKAERLQKAVDLALNWLHTIATAHHPTTTYYNLDAQTAIDEIKQLIKGE